MRRKLTITIDEDVYEGLHRVIGPRRISQFLETLARPHVIDADLDAAYAEMAADAAREEDALEWAEAAIGDLAGLDAADLDPADAEGVDPEGEGDEAG